jgi:hypothetical protein
MFEELDKKFDVTPIIPEVHSVVKFEVTDDTEKARETLHTLITKGNDAIDGILNIAKNSDHPRAYEVAGQLIKTVSDVAKDLVDIQKTKQELERKTQAQQIGTQNNVFVGSTHELMKMLKNVSPIVDAEIIDE